MSLGATVANALWLRAGRASARRFEGALGEPEEAQRRWLQQQLRAHAASAFGRLHDFPSLRTPADFARRVPLSRYEDVEPSIARIRRGERDVLAVGPVTHLAPTSGSTGARKLIPFTASLQRGFDAAVSAWMHDLARQRPALVRGPAYWSISPLTDDAESRPPGAREVVPVGFADDADYLGSARAWLVRQVMAAPSSLRHVRDMDAFWRLTALALLRRRSLRLISIWHPSFLDLLVAAARESWDALLLAIEGGTAPWLGALDRQAQRAVRGGGDRARARELRRIGADDWPAWWPHLQVISCWGEQGALAGWQAIAQRVAARHPRALVQPKGLLATEGVVTIPFASTHPLAVTSHFFEFLDQHGEARLAHQLQAGHHYEVVLTNGGGLWRYRLGDMVECVGHLRATPALRFLGRAERGSDLRGEKLSEVFVAQVLRDAWSADHPADYCALRARSDPVSAGYDLLLAAPPGVVESAAARVEQALSANPHYALARRLGQLQPVRGVAVTRDAARADLRDHGGRLGDAKPRVLLPVAGAAGTVDAAG